MQKDQTSWLYPSLEPYEHGFLEVGDGHKIYYEVCGNPEGSPVFAMHGGPGGGCDETMRRYFDPSVFKIVLHDQRGAGRSLPFASLENNTTPKLIEDTEKLRQHLQLDRVHVFGGSW